MIPGATLRGIYAILNEGTPDPVELARALLSGGVRIVQYRAKSGIDESRARMLRKLTREHQALLIVNDDWQAALAVDADGAHLGPGDASMAELPYVRRQLSGRILGVSCGTPEEARLAQAASADYLGVGSVYATGSKADAGAPIGIAGLRAVASAAPALPVAAIGGIDASNLRDVAASGVAMAAVLSAFSTSGDPAATARSFVRLWSAR